MPQVRTRRERRSHGLLIAGLVVLGLLLALDLVLAFVVTKPGLPARAQLVYGGAVPGTTTGNDNGLDELKFLRPGQFLMDYNYSPKTPGADSKKFLDQAEALGKRVMPNLSDYLAATSANDLAVSSMVQEVNSRDQIYGWYVTDELPADPDAPPGQPAVVNPSSQWLWQLHHRCVQLRQLTDKPLLGVFTWGYNAPPDYARLRFLQSIRAECPTMDIGIDYYPWPESGTSATRYGPVSAISEIGAVLWQVAGYHSWFIVQGFPWSREPGTAQSLGFSPDAPPPPEPVMVAMAQDAMHGGAWNIGWFSYPYAALTGQFQLNAMQQAGADIERVPGY